MTLFTKEGGRPNFLTHIIRQYEWHKYAPFIEPSSKNLFNVFDILRRRKINIDATDLEGNRIEVNQRVFRHWYTGGPEWTTNGIRVSIRQKLPEDAVGGAKYLSIIMSRDEKGNIDLATCVVVPTTTLDEQDQFGDYMRIGDLRTDTLTKNDNPFGKPEGKWFKEGQSFDASVTRAYLLLVKQLFGLGEVPPLGSSNGADSRMLLPQSK